MTEATESTGTAVTLVKITGIDVPFWDLMSVLIKGVIAIIPAYVIGYILYAFLGGMLVMTLGGVS